MDQETKRKAVQQYIQNYNRTPLKFKYYNAPENIELTETNVDKMVYRALVLSDVFPSENSDGRLETEPKRNRSSLDIWRHVIYYYPEITIFQVMNSLFNLKTVGEIGTIFCSQIMRRVFYLNSPSGDSVNDEYGLNFSDWGDI